MFGRKRTTYLLAGLVWAAGLAVGYVQLLAHAQTPGAIGATTADVPPPELRDGRTPGRHLVVLALHPRCPCSSATVGELADVLGWTPEVFDLVLLTYVPSDPAAGPWPAPTVPAALRRFLPRLVPDADGQLAARLGAETSGHVLVYNHADRPVFSGGVTPGRAHHGRTEGQRLLRDFLAERMGVPAMAVTAPVYGCPIRQASEETAR